MATCFSARSTCSQRTASCVLARPARKGKENEGGGNTSLYKKTHIKNLLFDTGLTTSSCQSGTQLLCLSVEHAGKVALAQLLEHRHLRATRPVQLKNLLNHKTF